MFKPVTISFLLAIICSSAMAQEKPSFNLTNDLVNRYVWRGTDYGKSAAIQPTMSITYKKFEFGFWGSFAFNSDYEEFDPYLKFTSNGYSVFVTDYYIPCLANTNRSSSPVHDTRFYYFKSNNVFAFDTSLNVFNNSTTCHALEGSFQYKNFDKSPFSFLAATYFYGNDMKVTDTVFYDTLKSKINQVNLKNQFSTYLEFTYTFFVNKTKCDLFLGMTPTTGAYSSDGFGVINFGTTAYKDIVVSEKLTIPSKFSFITNPKAGKLFFVSTFSF